MKYLENNKKRMRIIISSVIISVLFTSCGISREVKEKKKIRTVTQKYFDALRVGDWDEAYECYLPSEREKREAKYGVLGFVVKMIIGTDISGLLSNVEKLIGTENLFANYKYRVSDIEIFENMTDAIAYVEVFDINGGYGDDEYKGNFQVEMPPFMNLHKMPHAVMCNPAKPRKHWGLPT